jgi:hypothetical protein
VDVEWRIGRTQGSGARGPGFDPTSKPRMAIFWKLSSPLFQTTDLITISLFVILGCQVEINNIIKKEVIGVPTSKSRRKYKYRTEIRL